ncbi:putative membrane protein [Pseudooceanicola batsensis HTCC2597]|uniref:TRAP transporter small permease protein n=1 Tax=Pseudooceanicola batsensis (strain ATCC BAA-863 / DSM 15984 / KCTC 12145 / HTCC2597) TaxID=252305 RepID=A3TSX4_PSEBH|nr:TRAP transporter small permease subunit [Pseudooceanicola batsensis]EAQ04751.1 putative membrane protein [Pseudooceanicola batsensis HTCC2597]
MLQIAGGITRLNRFIGKWLSLAVLIIFAFLLADVVMRYLVGQPTIWTAELATLIFGVYAILGGGFLLAERGHVNVDIIYGSFSPRRKALLDILTYPLFLLFVGVLLWQGWDIAWESFVDKEQTNSIWKPYLWPTKAFIPVAAVLLLLQGFVRLWSDIRVLQGKPVPEDVFGVPAPSDSHANAAAAGEAQE